MSNDDMFEEFREDVTPTNEAFKQLAELVKAQNAADQEVLRAEAALKLAQDKVRQIQEHAIPDLMDSMGLKEFTTVDGFIVEIETKIRASIGDRKAEAFAWLIENGHGGMVKRTIEVAFNHDQQTKAEDLQKRLAGEYAGVRQNMKVEPASLTSWVRGQLKEGASIPMELFGVFDQKYATIKRKDSE